MTLADIARLRTLQQNATPYRQGHPATNALGAALAEHATFLINVAEREIRNSEPFLGGDAA